MFLNCQRWIGKGLDIAVLFRTSPLHTNENFEPEYANDLCKAWNDWMADFCKADRKRLKGIRVDHAP